MAFHVTFIMRSTFRVERQLTFTLFDDAMISLTYARNLAEGHGLVWMRAETAVEGYTNLLWTLWMALPHAVGVPERWIALPIMASGSLLLLGCAALAHSIARRLARLPVTPVLAAAAVVASYPLAFWTLRGLEVGLLAALVSAATLLALRLVERPRAADRAMLCLVLVAAVLTRTDAAALVLVVSGFLFLHGGHARRDAIAGALATFAALAAHTVFRIAYYGAALPNTYTLKIAGHPLGERVARGADVLGDLVAGTLWAPLGLAAVLLLARRTSLRPAEGLLGSLVVTALAYSVYVGGDVWEFAGFANRFVSVALPALLVLSLLGLEALLGARSFRALPPNRVAVVVTLLLLFLANGRSFEDWATRGGLHVQDDEILVRTAFAIRAATHEDARIAVVWAGAIPYFSRRPSIDLFGKNDPSIARLAPRGPFVPGHDKRDFAYSIGRLRPDIVHLGWRITPHEQLQLAVWGYERVAQYWVRNGADVELAELRRPWR